MKVATIKSKQATLFEFLVILYKAGKASPLSGLFNANVYRVGIFLSIFTAVIYWFRGTKKICTLNSDEIAFQATINHVGEVGNLILSKGSSTVIRRADIRSFIEFLVQNGGLFCRIETGSRIERVLIRTGGVVKRKYEYTIPSVLSWNCSNISQNNLKLSQLVFSCENSTHKNV